MTAPRPAAPPLERVLLGYAAGIAAATLTFSAALLVLGPESGPPRADLLGTVTLIAPFWASVAAVATVFPCLAAERLARLFGCGSAWWFAFWGVATGLGLGVPVLVGILGSYDDYGNSVTWADLLRNTGTAFAASGAAGGFTYWLVSRRPGQNPQLP